MAAGEADPGPSTPVVGALGLLAAVAVVLLERRVRHPMLPVAALADAQFRAANAVTFVVYGGSAFYC